MYTSIVRIIYMKERKKGKIKKKRRKRRRKKKRKKLYRANSSGNIKGWKKDEYKRKKLFARNNLILQIFV